MPTGFFFPRDVLDEIWDLIGSFSEGFPSYSPIWSCLSFLLLCNTINHGARKYAKKTIFSILELFLFFFLISFLLVVRETSRFRNESMYHSLVFI